MEKKIICITCPRGCVVTVKGDPAQNKIDSVEGNECRRGLTYAQNEFIHPVRILTSSVKTEGCAAPLMAVRTSAPIPKELLFDGMEEIKKITVKGPVATGDVIVANFLGTGADLVAAGSIE